MATLVVLSPAGPQVGNEFVLPAYEAVVVGRDKTCAVQIDSTSVSRLHARIYFRGDAWVVEDLQSTNGCFVNDVRVTTSVIRDSDALKIGDVVFRVRAASTFNLPDRDDQGHGGTGAPAQLGIQRRS